MNRNVRNTRSRKPVRPDARHSAKRRRRKKRSSAIPVLVALVFCALAMIPVVKVLTSDVDKPTSAQTAYREAEPVAPAATAAPEVTADSPSNACSAARPASSTQIWLSSSLLPTITRSAGMVRL